jgi:hypothetical protein
MPTWDRYTGTYEQLKRLQLATREQHPTDAHPFRLVWPDGKKTRWLRDTNQSFAASKILPKED